MLGSELKTSHGLHSLTALNQGLYMDHILRSPQHCHNADTYMYWVGQKVRLVFSIKDTLFIFTSNFIDLDILSMLAMSHVV